MGCYMIAYKKIELEKAAKQTGFVRDTFEKVLRLKEVLKYINSDAYLREHLALKGGTAINMTIFNLPRLSVDIDLDFTPNLSKDDTQMHRKQITEQLCEYMEESGYYWSESSRYSHSLDAFLFLYQMQAEIGIISRWKSIIPCGHICLNRQNGGL